MKPARQMLSVGIDIGTTTTQVVFSRLTLVDVARTGQIPRIDITEREVCYQSEIIFTPLLDPETIDAQRLSDILRQEYQRAGITPGEIETGAVIITGETAKKKNADRILNEIADLAGDFVVTVAGPHVEGMIAGRGSGAAQYSRKHFTSVINLDIGGGSANCATFRQGEMTAAAAMNYGGRIIEMDPASGAVRHLTQPAQTILAHLGLNLPIGQQPQVSDLRAVCNCMADLTIELIEGRNSPLAHKLYLTPPAAIPHKSRRIMISGGIGHYFYHPAAIHLLSDITVHGDIGPLLAECLRLHPALQSYEILVPQETLRATVLGASSQLIALSGSTIWTEEKILPLKNIPVVRMDVPDAALLPEDLAEALHSAVHRWDVDLSHDHFAIALGLDHLGDYAALQHIARGLHQFAASLPDGAPLIVIIQRDYAQSLGQTIRSLGGQRPLLVIDQVGLEEGDFIDIGEPLMDGRVVPLSVKTLIFYPS